MAAAQHWRVRGVRPYGTGNLEISELQLWGGGSRLDTSATITTPIAPSAGVLANLSDGNLTTSVTWPAAVYQSGGFTIEWLFSGSVSVDSVRIGTGASKDVSLRQLDLAYSTDGVTWQTLAPMAVGPVVYPGAYSGASADMPASFRYWSLYVTKWMTNGVENGGGQVRVAELQLCYGGVSVMGPPMTSNTSPAPYVASASSTLNGLYPAYAAFDGALGDGSRWISQNAYAGPERLTIDLGSAAPVNMVRIAPDTLGGAGHYLKEFQLQGSDTGAFAGEQTVVNAWSNLQQASWVSSAFTTFDFGTGGTLPLGTTSVSLIKRVRNFETGGNGYISGTVKVLGDPTNVPTRRRVRLLRDRDALLVAETWSDAVTGAYLFNEIDRTATYTVLTDDYQHSYRAVVADRITPSLMP